MKEHQKSITSGDILEMMVRAGLKPATETKNDVRPEDEEPQEAERNIYERQLRHQRRKAS